jgi:hypothetical protein
MRIVFQGYSIYCTLVCSVLIGALAFGFKDTSVETIARSMINLSYMVFGPLMLTFTNLGLIHFKNLAFTCSPRGITHHVNFVNIVVLLFCFLFSLCITFTMAMEKTLNMAQQGLHDENSLIYRITCAYFSYQMRNRYDEQRDVQTRRQEIRRHGRRQR